MEDHQQTLLSLFLEITGDQSHETATQFLDITDWNLEEAIQLFYAGGDVIAAPAPVGQGSSVWEAEPVREHSSYDVDEDEAEPQEHSSYDVSEDDDDDDDEEGEEDGVEVNNLASLYRPPHELMFRGSFDDAKDNARRENKWLLLNMQSITEFSSHTLNRDTWANQTVSETIKANFVFWQAYDDSEEGARVSNYYRLDSMPAVLVIDPITGQNMRSWQGMVQSETLLEELLPYMDGSPSDHHASLSHKRLGKSPQSTTPQVRTIIPHDQDEEWQRALAASRIHQEQDEELQRALVASMASVEIEENNVDRKVMAPDYMSLPEEPKSDKNLLCRVAARLPDGRRVQRSFLRSDPVQLLWSFCFSELKEERERPFRLAKAIPGVTNLLCRVAARLPDGRRVQRSFLRSDPVQLLWSFCFSELKEERERPFRLAKAIPGVTKYLDYDEQSTFQESGLANSMISVTWV